MKRYLLTIVLIFLGTSVAAAEDARIAIYGFDGAGARTLQTDVASALRRQSKVTVVPSSWVEAAASSMDADLSNPEDRLSLARELQLSAWVIGVVKRRGRRLVLTIVTLDAASNERLGRTTMAAASVRALKPVIKRTLWTRLGEAVAGGSVPGEESEEEEDASEEAAADEEESEAELAEAEEDEGADEETAEAEVPQVQDEEKPPALASSSTSSALGDDRGSVEADGARSADVMTLLIGVGSPFRSLSYNEPLSSGLGDYQLSGAPMVDLAFAYYPGGHASQRWPSWIGVEGRAQVALGINTSDREGNEYRSRYDAYQAGLRLRIPVRAHFVSVFSGYGMQRFSVVPQRQEVTSPMPDVDYRMVRVGAGTVLAATDAIALAIDAAWLHLLSVGELGDWFPRASAGAVELAGNVTYGISPRFFARAMVGYQRAFFDFRSRPDDAKQAGGAVDQYVTMTLGAGVRL